MHLKLEQHEYFFPYSYIHVHIVQTSSTSSHTARARGLPRRGILQENFATTTTCLECKGTMNSRLGDQLGPGNKRQTTLVTKVCSNVLFPGLQYVFSNYFSGRDILHLSSEVYGHAQRRRARQINVQGVQNRLEVLICMGFENTLMFHSVMDFVVHIIHNKTDLERFSTMPRPITWRTFMKLCIPDLGERFRLRAWQSVTQRMQKYGGGPQRGYDRKHTQVRVDENLRDQDIVSLGCKQHQIRWQISQARLFIVFSSLNTLCSHGAGCQNLRHDYYEQFQ